MKPTEAVQSYVLEKYIAPARRRGDVTVKVVAGDVHRALRLENRVPLVCNALKSKNFLNEFRLSIEKVEGPPSGQSTTVTVVYRMLSEAPAEVKREAHPLWALRGAGKQLFAELGGGEAYIRALREDFFGGKDRQA